MPKSLPQELRSILAAALAEDPALRPPNASGMLELLGPFVPRAADGAAQPKAEKWTRGIVVARGRDASDEPVKPAPAAVQVGRGRRAAAIAGPAVVSAALAAFAMYSYTRPRPSAPAPRLAPSAGASVAGTVSPERLAPSASSAPSAAATPSTTPQPASPTAPSEAAPSAVSSAAPTRASSSASAVRAPRVEPVARAPGAGQGTLVFQSARGCALMLDGELRGEVASTRLPLAAGPHALTCQSGDETVRLTVRIREGVTTRVRVNANGETEVDLDAPR